MSDNILDALAYANVAAGRYLVSVGRVGRANADGSTDVEVPGELHKVFVQLGASDEIAGLVEARNMGAPRLAGTPVLLQKIDGAWTIIDVDMSSPALTALMYPVAYHDHAPNTGLAGDSGAWSPAGNGVTLVGVRAYYIRNGGIVYAWFDVAWPTTADTGDARIYGLPARAAGDAFDIGTVAFRYIGLAAGLTGGVLYNQSYIELLSIAAPPVVLTNADMSEVRISGVAIYPVS